MKLETIEIQKQQQINKKEKMLNYLRDFLEKNGRSPIQKDFMHNPKYPSYITYCRIFGSWNNALDLANLKTIKGGQKIYNNDELLNFLQQFYNENGRIPTCKDLDNNDKYPSYITYYRIFGSMNKALKLINLDVDSILKKGVIENNYQKGRLFELKVKEHFEKESIDLSGENPTRSHSDGICPCGNIYDAKSSKLNIRWNMWQVKFRNKYKHEIQWYYIGLFDENFDKLLHVLRIPSLEFKDTIESSYMNIYMKGFNKHTIENLNKYIITKKFGCKS